MVCVSFVLFVLWVFSCTLEHLHCPIHAPEYSIHAPHVTPHILRAGRIPMDSNISNDRIAGNCAGSGSQDVVHRFTYYFHYSSYLVLLLSLWIPTFPIHRTPCTPCVPVHLPITRNAYMFIYTHVYIYIYIYIHTHVYVCVYIERYTHI